MGGYNKQMNRIKFSLLLLNCISIYCFSMDQADQEKFRLELQRITAVGNVEQLASILQLSFQQGKPAHKENMRGLLHIAARKNFVGCIYVLLNAGADINSSATLDGHAQTPLRAAIESQLLFIDGPKKDKQPAPPHAAKSVDTLDQDSDAGVDTTQTIRELLAHGANPTPALDFALVHLAKIDSQDPKYEQTSRIINLLVDYNAFPADYEHLEQLIMYLVNQNDDNNLQKIVRKAQQVENQPSLFDKAIEYAARNNRIQCLITLLTPQNMNNRIDIFNRTPLIAAVESQLMFIVGKNNQIKIPLIQDLFTNPDLGGNVDTSEAIQFLLEVDANPSLFMLDHTSALGLALRVKSYFPQNAPERERIDQIINLLREHHATLCDEEEFNECCKNNPLIHTFNNKINDYVDNKQAHEQRMQARCKLLTKGVLLGSFMTYCASLYRSIKTRKTSHVVLACVSGALFFLLSQYKKKFARWAHDKALKIHNKFQVRSLLSTTEKIRATNPDQQTKKVLQFIVAKSKASEIVGTSELIRQCAARLDIKITD